MTDQDMQSVLQEAVEFYVGHDPHNPDISITSFADAGVLTRNAGLVLRLDDGSEFQVTVVQSRQERLSDAAWEASARR